MKALNRNYQNIKVSFLILPVLLLSACQSTPTRDPEFAAVRPALPPVEPISNGAIYKTGFETRLFEDTRARRVGDILTVNLVENTQSSKEATTDISKATNSTIDNPTILGTSAEIDLPGFLPLANTSDLSLNSSLNSSHTFSGSGGSDQNNSLTGSIAVHVVEVFPNGNLAVRGEKRMTLNQGNEYIRISGIVRPVDIATNNSVQSTQIADATIMYTGDGDNNASNVMGWLAKFFISAVMPF